MPIGISDQRPKRIQPAQSSGIVISQTAGIFERDRGTRPRIRKIVMHRGKAEHSDASSCSGTIKSLAFEKPMRGRLEHVCPRGRHSV